MAHAIAEGILPLAYNVPGALYLTCQLSLRRYGFLYERYATYNLAGWIASRLTHVGREGLVGAGMASRAPIPPPSNEGPPAQAFRPPDGCYFSSPPLLAIQEARPHRSLINR